MFRRLALPVLIALLGARRAPRRRARPAGSRPPQPADRRAERRTSCRSAASTWRATAPAALVYLKRVDGVAARLRLALQRRRVPRARARRQRRSAAARATRSIAAADGDRLRVAWIAGSRVYGAVVAGSGRVRPAARPDRALQRPVGRGQRRRRSTWASTAPPTRSGRPRAAAAPTSASARLQDATWTDVGAPLDVDPGARRRARRASARASAVSGRGQRGRGLGRGQRGRAPARLRAPASPALNLSAFPQELSLPSSAARRRAADSPDIDIEDDGSFAWVVFRQDIGGGSRSSRGGCSARTFDPPVPLDGGPPADRRRGSRMNGARPGARGVRERRRRRARPRSLYHDVFEPGRAARAPRPAAGAGAGAGGLRAPRGRVAGLARRAATVDGPAASRDRRSRSSRGRRSRGPTSARWPAGRSRSAADRVGGFAVAMVQGAPTAPRDHGRASTTARPGRRASIARSACRAASAAEARAGARASTCGARSATASSIGGKVVGETTGTSLVPTVSGSAPGGRITYQVDRDRPARPGRRRSRGAPRALDNDAPRLTRAGRRQAARAGGRCKIVVKPRRQGLGRARRAGRYGDSKRVVEQRKRFSGAARLPRGHFTLKVTVVDKAGNAPGKKVKLRIT